MAEYEFELIFQVRCDSSADRETWADGYIENLGEVGCTDATIGVGRVGILGMRFAREAGSAMDAMASAIRDVQCAVPGAVLFGAGPDLVGVSEIARTLDQTPQNIRKKIGKSRWPIAAGGSGNVWHLATVLDSLDSLAPNADAAQMRRLERLRDVSRYAMLINHRSELLSLSVDDEAESRVSQWVGAGSSRAS